MSLLVIVPSRGRPSAVSSLLTAVKSTKSEASTGVKVCVDSDDVALPAYLKIDGIDLRVGRPDRIGPTLNEVALAHAPFYDHIGFMGDDHRPRTKGWDAALCTNGVAYGNDLIHGAGLPTAVVMNSRIILDLGYFVPVGAWHLYLDNAWKDIGDRYGLDYRADIVMEHLHPLVGKAPSDALYERNNSDETNAHDREVYENWKREFNDRRPAL